MDTSFQIALTSTVWRVPFSELGQYMAKKRRIPVKYKSADMYVGRPNSFKNAHGYFDHLNSNPERVPVGACTLKQMAAVGWS